MRLIILLLVAFIALANGHAVLVKPTPFSSNPSTASPCGSGVPQTTNVLGTVCRGKVNKFDWKVVVGDGTGAVTFKLSSTNSASNFDVNIGTSEETPSAVGDFTLSVNVPKDISLGKFLMKASSTSNWNSCSFVEVTDNCTGIESKTTEVLKIDQNSGVEFCKSKIMKNVLVPIGTVLKTYDNSTKNVFNANMANKNVIGINTTECGALYKPILCDVSFPQVSGENDTKPIYTVTYDQCQQYVETCGVETHIDLYPCTMFGLENNSGSLLSISSLLSILILSIALLL